MRIILIRHGSRTHEESFDDKDTQLSEKGRNEAMQLTANLNLLVDEPLVPDIFLSSMYNHAVEMADVLNSSLLPGETVDVVKLCSLTPHCKKSTFAEIIYETDGKKIALREYKTIVIVGHEGRLSQLLTRMTSKRVKPFDRACAVCLTAESLDDFIKGNAEIEFRLPVDDFQEDELRTKIRSKMTVSTFLTGFAATILFNLVRNPEPTYSQYHLVHALATIFMTAALILFIAAVYMYDRLAMPEGFWTYGERIRHNRPFAKQFKIDLRQNGPLYAHMIWTWKYVFTPAVCLALCGFLSLLIITQDTIIISGCVTIILVVLVYYRFTRPMLGVD